MIKKFFEELERVLGGIANDYKQRFKTHYKVERRSYGRDVREYARLVSVSNDISENDLDINGGKFREWYPRLELYVDDVDGSIFRLCLEYLYNSDNPKRSGIIKYGVRRPDVDWSDIQDEDYNKINLLHKDEDCEKLEDLFYMFLQNYENVSWHSGQQVFCNMANKFRKTSWPDGDVLDYYFSLGHRSDSSLVKIITSNNLLDEKHVKQQALLEAQKMFRDALLIKWF